MSGRGPAVAVSPDAAQFTVSFAVTGARDWTAWHIIGPVPDTDDDGVERRTASWYSELFGHREPGADEQGAISATNAPLDLY